MNIDAVELSRAVSHALRHAPEIYALTLDPEGWVSTKDLIIALSRTHPEWSELDEGHLYRMIAESKKRRHEIAEGRIRALYGHSTPERLIKTPRKPPEVLYHGTDSAAADAILIEGLKSMGRQYTHLSADTQTAYEVGKRRAARPVILAIRAAEAFQSGVSFYEGADSVWLADDVPPTYISRSH